ARPSVLRVARAVQAPSLRCCAVMCLVSLSRSKGSLTYVRGACQGRLTAEDGSPVVPAARRRRTSHTSRRQQHFEAAGLPYSSTVVGLPTTSIGTSPSMLVTH